MNYFDDEGLAFEDDPAAFVLLDRNPVIWTVRGLRHFSPRFRLIGVSPGRVRSAEQFRRALARWNALEWQMLVDRIEVGADDSKDELSRRCLWAILTSDQGAQALIAKLEANPAGNE